MLVFAATQKLVLLAKTYLIYASNVWKAKR